MTALTFRILKSTLLTAAAIGAAFAGCTPKPGVAPNGTTGDPIWSAQDAKAAQIARGAKLVSIGGCNDCHTPMKFDPAIGMPVPDMTRMLSGHPEGAPDPASDVKGHDMAAIGPTFTSFRLPFGVVYSMNLTPDAETGLGTWNEEMFVRALKTGKHFGGNGRPILPPMPWMTLAQQSEDDLKAIFAYLRTVKPIRNGIPDVKVPQPAMDAIGASYDKVLRGAAGPQASR